VHGKPGHPHQPNRHRHCTVPPIGGCAGGCGCQCGDRCGGGGGGLGGGLSGLGHCVTPCGVVLPCSTVVYYTTNVHSCTPARKGVTVLKALQHCNTWSRGSGPLCGAGVWRGSNTQVWRERHCQDDRIKMTESSCVHQKFVVKIRRCARATEDLDHINSSHSKVVTQSESLKKSHSKSVIVFISEADFSSGFFIKMIFHQDFSAGKGRDPASTNAIAPAIP